MSGSEEKLSRKQDQAISALLTCTTLTDAAARCRVGESTLRRWLAVPAFKTAYLTARREVVQHAITQMQQACSQAVTTLVAILENADVSASARVSAAKVILETALKAVELEELEARLAALETAQMSQEGHR